MLWLLHNRINPESAYRVGVPIFSNLNNINKIENKLFLDFFWQFMINFWQQTDCVLNTMVCWQTEGFALRQIMVNTGWGMLYED